MRRPKGCESKIMTADGVVFSGNKNVYAVIVTPMGATAGDRFSLKDTSAGGAIRLPITIPSANGSVPADLGRFGMEFLNGCYFEYSGVPGKTQVTIIFG
jgi:hypothetical protein